MIFVWFIGAAVAVGNWFTDALPDGLPTITFPSGYEVVIPIPGVTAGTLSAMNGWIGLAFIVVCALALGRLLMFVYRLIPFNG